MNEIGEELYWLAMRNNQLTTLPKCISGCCGLKQIDMSRNLIDTIEDFTLPVLADLNLGNNSKLECLGVPSSTFARRVRSLPPLSAPFLRPRAGLAELPDTFAGMRSLVKLNLSHNQLQQLPPSVGQMPSLKFLDVSHNVISELPSFDGARKLTTLGAFANCMAFVPSLAHCAALTDLDLAQNKLNEWPDLPPDGQMVRLVVSNNPMPELSGELVWSMRDSLKELGCGSCGLSFLPEEIGALKCLRILNCEFNEMKDIPASLGYLPDVISLRCAFVVGALGGDEGGAAPTDNFKH